MFSETSVFNPVFKVGMFFIDKKVMNAMIKSKAIGDNRNIKLHKNDWRQVHAKCAD